MTITTVTTGLSNTLALTFVLAPRHHGGHWTLPVCMYDVSDDVTHWRWHLYWHLVTAVATECCQSACTTSPMMYTVLSDVNACLTRGPFENQFVSKSLVAFQVQKIQSNSSITSNTFYLYSGFFVRFLVRFCWIVCCCFLLFFRGWGDFVVLVYDFVIFFFFFLNFKLNFLGGGHVLCGFFSFLFNVFFLILM